MKRINDHEVELTEAEQIIAEWYEDEMSKGFSQQEAVDYVTGSCAEGSLGHRTITDPEFRAYLLT